MHYQQTSENYFQKVYANGKKVRISKQKYLEGIKQKAGTMQYQNTQYQEYIPPHQDFQYPQYTEQYQPNLSQYPSQENLHNIFINSVDQFGKPRNFYFTKVQNPYLPACKNANIGNRVICQEEGIERYVPINRIDRILKNDFIEGSIHIDGRDYPLCRQSLNGKCAREGMMRHSDNLISRKNNKDKNAMNNWFIAMNLQNILPTTQTIAGGGIWPWKSKPKKNPSQAPSSKRFGSEITSMYNKAGQIFTDKENDSPLKRKLKTGGIILVLLAIVTYCIFIPASCTIFYLAGRNGARLPESLKKSIPIKIKDFYFNIVKKESYFEIKNFNNNNRNYPNGKWFIKINFAKNSLFKTVVSVDEIVFVSNQKLQEMQMETATLQNYLTNQITEYCEKYSDNPQIKKSISQNLCQYMLNKIDKEYQKYQE